jgi:hypothetical protein
MISDHSEKEIISKLAWQSGLSILFGSALAAGSLLFLLRHSGM